MQESIPIPEPMRRLADYGYCIERLRTTLEEEGNASVLHVGRFYEKKLRETTSRKEETRRRDRRSIEIYRRRMLLLTRRMQMASKRLL
mmetsp:Transcript_2490/g.3825  ORF Transcript_2490/g.3825 Transcript_2490/m.3825 type:complete len:88 (-) Transcript_2490:415-678(-)